MFKTIQIIKYMKSNGFNEQDILSELSDIAKNKNSILFEVNEAMQDQISNILFNENNLKAAFQAANLLGE